MRPLRRCLTLRLGVPPPCLARPADFWTRRRRRKRKLLRPGKQRVQLPVPRACAPFEALDRAAGGKIKQRRVRPGQGRRFLQTHHRLELAYLGRCLVRCVANEARVATKHGVVL